MFHVSHLLPFMESDPQQLQRKRHIGKCKLWTYILWMYIVVRHKGTCTQAKLGLGNGRESLMIRLRKRGSRNFISLMT
jgi:hypothetical protein